MVKALGMIECVGLCAAVAISDVMLKAGNVSLIEIEIVDEFTTVKVEGDIAAVEAACRAGLSMAKKMCGFLAMWVIPRPNSPTTSMFERIHTHGGRYCGK